MSLTSEVELEIRKAIGARFAPLAPIGFFLPSPLFYADRADFFALLAPLLTQKEIEQTQIAFCMMSLLKFTDSLAEGCIDEPLVRLTYNFYFFRELFADREDESETPDIFLKLLLKSYNDFVKSVLNVRIQFLGLRAVPGNFPDGFLVNTNSIVQDEFIEEKGVCRYIPDATGHSVDLQCTVEVLITND